MLLILNLTIVDWVSESMYMHTDFSYKLNLTFIIYKWVKGQTRSKNKNLPLMALFLHLICNFRFKDQYFFFESVDLITFFVGLQIMSLSRDAM